MPENSSLKLVIHPAFDEARFEKVAAAAGRMKVVNAADHDEALREIVDADALMGKLTPELLAASTKLCWVQTMTASLEHYVFSELVKHPCQLTNMRGLFSDIIADHVFGYILCFARNFHVYIAIRWKRVGHRRVASPPGRISFPGRA